ncbi:MAG: hypothetical protein K0M40_14770 [Prolixibacteraceae bacterium]|nr:hypothetical protein [Prolixibacteraceae bacterium]
MNEGIDKSVERNESSVHGVSVPEGGKVCVLNDRFLGPIIQNLHVGQ